jgi:hypothetical protein
VTAVQAEAGEMLGPQRLAQAWAPLAQVGVAEVLLGRALVRLAAAVLVAY